MNVSLPTKSQWVSIGKNTLFFAISSLLGLYSQDPTYGVVAMFVLKVVEKVLVPEKLQ